MASPMPTTGLKSTFELKYIALLESLAIREKL